MKSIYGLKALILIFLINNESLTPATYMSTKSYDISPKTPTTGFRDLQNQCLRPESQ
jgi:hypothetical protein